MSNDAIERKFFNLPTDLTLRNDHKSKSESKLLFNTTVFDLFILFLRLSLFFDTFHFTHVKTT